MAREKFVKISAALDVAARPGHIAWCLGRLWVSSVRKAGEGKVVGGEAALKNLFFCSRSQKSTGNTRRTGQKLNGCRS